MTIDLSKDSAVFTQDFAETVRFRAKPSDSAREIEGVVNRQPLEGDGVSPFDGHQANTMTVLVQNDATEGVTPGEINDDESELEVARRKGESRRWRRITRVPRHNGGCLLLEVRA